MTKYKLPPKNKHPRKPSKEFPYIDNLRADPRLLSVPHCNVPLAEQVSASRLDMYRSQTGQTLIIDGAEFPQLFSGFEWNLGQYEMSGTSRPDDLQILDVVPKYLIRAFNGRLTNNPTRTVIGKDSKGVIHYFNLNSYYMGSDGFGYETQFKNTHLLMKDSLLEKDVVLAHSKARQGEKYCTGANLQTAYLTVPETIEDALVISESAADKLTSTAIHEMIINIKPNEHPINHYGDDETYKFLPDIGEKVGDDGILCAFRYVDQNSFASDMKPSEMKEIQAMHDHVIRTPPGAEILDIDVFPCARSRDKVPWSIFAQVEPYIDAARQYWERIIEVYEQLGGKYKLSPAFNTLVTEAYMYASAYGSRIKDIPHRKIQFVDRKEETVEFLQIRIVYKYKRRPGVPGFKLCDRYGTKGIECVVVPNDHMPVDEHGFRAEVMVHPGSVIARMNPSQLTEQFLNRCSEFVRRRLEEVYPTNPDKAVSMLFDYFNDVNPNYHDLILKVRNTKEGKYALVEECIKDRIYLNSPPFLETMYDDYAYERGMAKFAEKNPKRAKEMMIEDGFNPEDLLPAEAYPENLVLKLAKKWGVEESPVVFKIKEADGTIKEIKSRENVCIGPRYTHILYKIPSPSSPGVSYVSHHGIPMKGPSEAKMATMAAPTSLREGEDELRILLADIFAEDMLRFTGLQSASLTAVNHVTEALLSAKYPMNIEQFDISTEKIRDTHAPIMLLRHMMATIGVDVANTRAKPSDFPDFMLNGQNEEDDVYAEDDIKTKDVLNDTDS